ncbi:glycosyltransferase family 4 protein [Priestia megaterium]|uniref:Glycosyltransferase n=1 Tax=Priestia megaterium TaxID=1404 RepID=A0AAX6BFV2_PRIMG|nr:glycosyltransferase family 4 protein [Priestia megaterium]GMG72633.1 hypothetical protein ShirakiTB12_11010 [Priestia megaterium]
MIIKIGIVSPIDIMAVNKIRPLKLIKGKVVPQGLGATFLTCVIDELILRGHQVIIFTLDKEVKEETVLLGENIKIYVNHYRERKRALNFFKTEINLLKKMIRKEKVDVLHAHWTYEFSIAALSADRRTLVTAHDSPFKVLKYMPSTYRFVRLLMAYYALHKTQRLTVVSNDTANHLQKFKFYNDKKIEVIPNPILIRPELLPATQKDGGENVIFASVMNGTGKLKNPVVLLKAFQKLRLKFKNVKLIMIGEGYENLGIMHKWSKENNCDIGVQFKGQLIQEELIQYLQERVDVLVHPSKEESFSLIIAEAMSLGIPIIGGKNSGAVPYTMGDGVAGILVDIKSVNEISEAMEKLLNSSLRIKIGIEGHKFARQNYSLETVANSYEQLYKEIYSVNRG